MPASERSEKLQKQQPRSSTHCQALLLFFVGVARLRQSPLVYQEGRKEGRKDGWMDGKWSGNSFLLDSSPLANHGGYLSCLFYYFKSQQPSCEQLSCELLVGR
jgi:hypothetical protein